MRKERNVPVVCGCLLLILMVSGSLAGPRSVGTVAGVVTLPDTTIPAGIFVTVIGQNKSAVTDVAGNFLIDGVTAGLIRVQAGKLGYGNGVVDTTLSAAQTLTLTLQLSSAVRDTEAVIQTSSFTTSVTNEGNIGAVNKFVDSNEVGFRWNGAQELKEGSLMVGIDSTRVSDAARFLLGIAQNNLDHDFQPLSDIVVRASGPDSVVYATSFDDSRSNFPPGIPSQPLGVRMTQECFAFPGTQDSGYLIVKLTITNTASVTLQNLLVGYFVDWDIQPTPSNNRGDVIKVQNQIPGINGGLPFISEIALQRDATSGTRFMGIVPLSQPQFKAARIASVQQEIVSTGQNTGLTEANKYLYMRDRRPSNDTTDLGIEEDLATIASVGGATDTSFAASTITLPAYSSVVVGFGFVGGSDSLQCIANALSAQKKWVDLGNAVNLITAVHEGLPTLPGQFILEQNYPNPFNPSTVIRYSLPKESYVTLKVYNVLGEEIATLVNGKKAPGIYSVNFDGRTRPSGVYFYRLSAGPSSQARKMMLLK